MGYSKEHVARTRQRILDCAGSAFRKHGFDGAGIDQIMSDAGLTRGGFYAHFKSKKDLFQAVIAEEFDFTRQVAKLADLPKGQVAHRVMFAITHYLDESKSTKIAEACTMASLSTAVSRDSDLIKCAFGSGLRNLVMSIDGLLKKDGLTVHPNTISSVVSLCVGALILARSVPERDAAEILNAARETAGLLLTEK